MFRAYFSCDFSTCFNISDSALRGISSEPAFWWASWDPCSSSRDDDWIYEKIRLAENRSQWASWALVWSSLWRYGHRTCCGRVQKGEKGQRNISFHLSSFITKKDFSELFRFSSIDNTARCIWRLYDLLL